MVCGPTASGKTDVAIALARALHGEVVNADSRQVYRYMDIGTAKPTPAQRAATPHHLLDVVEPDAPFTLADYLERARAAVTAITGRGRLPIVAGGTGLYVRALAQGFAVPSVPPNAALTRRTGRAGGTGRSGGPAGAAAAQRPPRGHDGRRAQPASTGAGHRGRGGDGQPWAAQQAAQPPYDMLVLGLTRPPCAALRPRRSTGRRHDGRRIPDEVAGLRTRGYSAELPALSSLGYRELGEHLDGRRTLADAVQATKYATHRFIRRQFTWFRREPGIRWLDVADGDPAAAALTLVGAWSATAPAQRAG